MKKILVFLAFINSSVFSQNLILNSSFEDRFSCPYNTNSSSIHRLQNNVYYWNSSLWLNTYFHTCAYNYNNTYNEYAVPINFAGNQYARTGEGYTGSYVFGINQRGQIPFPGFDYCTSYYQRGFFWQKLENSLQIGKKYYFEIYTSLSDRSSYQRNSIGVKLTLDTPMVETQDFAMGIFQLRNDTVQLNDTIGWNHLQWIFEADSTYEFVTIGPANTCINENDTIFIQYDSFTLIDLRSFYYFDDVGLYEIQGSSSTQTFCGNTATLSTPAGSFNHIWSNGGRAASTTITQSGTYTVFYRLDSLAFSDTIHVEFVPTIADNFLGQDTLYLIPQTSLTIEGPSGFSYLWNTGHTDKNLEVALPGTYILTVTDINGCMTTDTVEVLWDTTVGYDTFWQPQNLKIYPNPATNLLSISHSVSDVCTLELYNAAGQMVLTENFSNQTQINVHTFPQGVYFVKVFSRNKMPIVKKVVINH